MNRYLSCLGILAAAGTTLFSAGAVQAAGITFDLTGSRADQESFLYTEDGIGLTVTASEDGDARDVSRRNRGLGVVGLNGSALEANGLARQIDGRQVKGGSFISENLVLTFDQSVKLLSATFDRLQNNDNFRLSVDGVEVIGNGNPGATLFGFVGSEFTFSAAQRNDDYSLDSVTVETVPEPLTLLGSAAALGMGAALKRKRSAAVEEA